jgi:hypothetical protein
MYALSRSNPEAGITFMKGIEYIEAPGPEYGSLTEERARTELGMPGWRRLETAEFPDERVKWGCEYDTWCVNPMVYCAFLLRRFVMRGGRVVQGVVREVEEVWAMGFELGRLDGVVNATGHGFGDKDMFVTRGMSKSSAWVERVWLLWMKGLTKENRSDMSGRQHVRRNSNPPKCRWHLDILRAAELRRGDGHRRHQRAG